MTYEAKFRRKSGRIERYRADTPLIALQVPRATAYII